MIKISILIPVYNVEKYLQRCVDSVLAQDFTDWEMILVDDGSPDRCPQMCDAFAAKDTRIKVVHKKNGGLVSARKAGFEQSKGEYLMFLDSDDWLLPKALSTLYAKITEGYDIVRGRNYMAFDDGSRQLEEPRLAIGELNSADEYFRAMINATMSPYLWGAMYRRSLFSSAVFEPLIPFSIGEDWMTNLSIAKHVKKVCLLGDVVYCYYINPQSMMHQKVCSREYSDYVEQTLSTILKNSPQEWKRLVQENRMRARISSFFCPELGFDNEYYEKVTHYIDSESDFESLKKEFPARYVLFIRNQVIFRIYTYFYRFLFLHKKLKGIKRNEIK